MNTYQEYAQINEQIRQLTIRLGELKPQLLAEMADLVAPLKTKWGTFSKVKSIKWEFSEAVTAKEAETKEKIKELSAPLLAEVEAVKKAEIESGEATQQTSQTLRFIPKDALLEVINNQ